VICGGLFCLAVEISGEREQEAITQEIQDRTARGDRNAEWNVVMEHKTMPIAVALGFLMELAVVCAVGALLGGLVMSVAITARAKAGMETKDGREEVATRDSHPAIDC
jgi:hypothetical protein